MIFLYYPLSIFTMFSNISFLLYHIGNLCFWFFFLMINIASSLSILLIFSKGQLSVSLIFSSVFSFSIPLISALYYLLCSAYFVLDLLFIFWLLYIGIEGMNVGPFFFSSIIIWSYTFHFKHWLRCIPQL